MRTQKSVTKIWGITTASYVVLTAVISAIPTHAATDAVKSVVAADVSAVQEGSSAIRLAHARELLGKSYDHSAVKGTESISSMKDFIRESVEKALPVAYKKQSRQIAGAIIAESARYGFDPVLLMAVIQHESRWNPEVVGGVGEIGLMQIRPETAEWIAKKAGVIWKGKSVLFHPVTNIRIGARHLAMLRQSFNSQGGRYLAAYNMGSTKLRRSLASQIVPKTYAVNVMKNYLSFYTELKNQQRRNSFRVVNDEMNKLNAKIAEFRRF
jgi:soluble lytic murein transglycosylase